MVDISLDLNPASPTYRDLLVIDGDLVLTSDADPRGTNPILQELVQRLSMFLGEWFLDNTQGFPWFQQVLIKGADQSKVDALVLNTILGTTGVTQCVSYSLSVDRERRIITMAFKVFTTMGPLTYNGELLPGLLGGPTT